MMSQAYICKHLRVHCPCACKWMIYVPFVILDSALRPIYRLADKKRSSQTDAKVINWHERDWSSMPQKPCHLHVNVWKRSHREPALWWHDKEIWCFFANCFYVVHMLSWFDVLTNNFVTCLIKLWKTVDQISLCKYASYIERSNTPYYFLQKMGLIQHSLPNPLCANSEVCTFLLGVIKVLRKAVTYDG